MSCPSMSHPASTLPMCQHDCAGGWTHLPRTIPRQKPQACRLKTMQKTETKHKIPSAQAAGTSETSFVVRSLREVQTWQTLKGAPTSTLSYQVLQRRHPLGPSEPPTCTRSQPLSSPGRAPEEKRIQPIRADDDGLLLSHLLVVRFRDAGHVGKLDEVVVVESQPRSLGDV